jgi:hypothetical protein
MLDHSTMSLFPMIVFLSLGGIFGRIFLFFMNIFGRITFPGVAFFVWLATLGKILTMDNLRKWHVIVVNWC